MKKIYSFIALMLMCFAGTANAQKDWTPVDETENVETIVPGEDHFYVLKGGSNTKDDGSDGKDVIGTREYLSAGAKTGDITDAAVFNFIQVAVKTVEGQDFPVYVLKNVSNGKYLSNGKTTYVDTKAEAFSFTARKAVLVDEASLNEETPWIEYSVAASETRSQEAETLGAWVLCTSNDVIYKQGDDPDIYICFYGNPAFASWVDTNNWLITEVEGTEQSDDDKYTAIYEKYFPEDFDPETAFPIGENPGCVSEEFAAHVAEVYEDASNLLNSGDAESYKAMAETIINLFEKEIPQALIPVAPGYFVLKNVGGRGFLTVFDNGKGRGNSELATKNVVDGTDYDTWTPASTTAWNLNNVKYIWKLETSKEDGKLLFQNFGTGKYLATEDDYQTVEKDAAVPFKVSNYLGQEFLVTFGSNGMVHVANHSNNKLLNYNDPNDVASRWVFYTIGQNVIDSMSVKVAQSALNEDLKATLAQANEDYYGNQYTNFVPGNLYKDSLDAGLVDSVFATNANDGNKTGAEIFDNNIETFYHTSYGENKLEPGTRHWIKLDLGKKVSKLVVKFTKRQKQANNHISKYALFAPANGDTTQAFNQLVAMSEDSISYQYSGNTHIAEYELKTPVQYVSFEVLNTRGRDASTFDKMSESGSGPFWHMAELRLYDPDDFVKNPAYDLIPQNVKDELLASIKKGEAELAEKKATQATIDEIDANLKKFWEAYPDASGLKSDLENAAKMVEFVTELDDPTMGFYPIGSKDALLQVVETISANVKATEDAGKALSLKEIEDYTAQLDAAIDAFNAKLVKPVAGNIYIIVGKSVVSDSEAPQVDGCIASVDADLKNGSPVFRYKYGVDDFGQQLNALWLAEDCEGGLAFKNLANGLYMNNVYFGLTEEQIDSLELPNNQIGYSKTPKPFYLESFSKENYAEMGYFVMSLMKGQYINFQKNGQVMVHYYDRNDDNAPLTFVDAVNEEDISFTGDYHVNVEAGKVQVLSFPVDLISVSSSHTEFSEAYEVVGRNGDNLMMQPVDGTIAAGTPFVVQTRAAESADDVEAGLLNTTVSITAIDDYESLVYNYDVVAKNGLVSTPQSIELGEGYGVIVNGTVVPTKAGATVGAGKGYFNKDIPATTEVTEFIIPVEGAITGGDITGVENVEIVKNVPSDVYTVAGVKVRSNVKLSNATQGLPKGVYIVAGKKVIVK